MKVDIRENRLIITEIKGSSVKNKKEYKIKNGTLEIDIDQLPEKKNIFVFLDEKENQAEQLLNQFQYYELDGIAISCYLSKSKNLIISKGKKFVTNSSLAINSIKYTDDKLKFTYKKTSHPSNPSVTGIVFRERKTSFEFKRPVGDDEGILEVNVSTFQVDGIYDIYAEIKIDGERSIIKRISKTRFKEEFFFKKGVLTADENTKVVIFPYTTYKARKLSLKVNKVNAEGFEYLYKKNKNRRAILIGEQPNKAQDNGYFLFKYIRETHPDAPVYYVIDENCNDYARVEPLGNIVKFGSLEHFKIISEVKYFVSTHHPDYLLPFYDPSVLEKKGLYKIFLQHGVMGTKYMANHYGKYSNNPFDVDLFIVSSEREKKMIVEDFEYENSEVKVTGLSRFDSLFANDETVDIDILVIPTWRDWLQNASEIEATLFYSNYMSLVSLLSEKYRMRYVLHTNMAHYKQHFIDKGIDVAVATEVNVQSLMKKSKLMITDYSSVGFDFSFLGKPVIYYQFDQKKFFGKEGSHFDIYSELPGKICKTEEEVLKTVQELSAGGYKQDRESQEKSNHLIKYRDQNASKRIYEEILNCNRKSRKKFLKSNRFLKRILKFEGAR